MTKVNDPEYYIVKFGVSLEISTPVSNFLMLLARPFPIYFVAIHHAL